MSGARVSHAEMRAALIGQFRMLPANKGKLPSDNTVGMLYVAQQEAAELAAALPIPMRLRCPGCGELHIDVGEFATKPHHTHACQDCGEVWRPAVVCTVGVQFLPGFKNGAEP